MFFAFRGNLKNGPFWPKLTQFHLAEMTKSDSKLWFLELFAQIGLTFVLNLCSKLYLNTLEHKR